MMISATTVIATLVVISTVTKIITAMLRKTCSQILTVTATLGVVSTVTEIIMSTLRRLISRFSVAKVKDTTPSNSSRDKN